jgi:hypothetical protein
VEVPEPKSKIPEPSQKTVKDGQFVSMSKRAGTILPAFQTVEKGVIYSYDSIGFGKDLIYMHCSNKSSGCCAKATIKPLNSIVKRKTPENDFSSSKNLTFINQHSEENFKIQNYDAETIGRPSRGKGDWRVHTCDGYIPGKI